MLNWRFALVISIFTATAYGTLIEFRRAATEAIVKDDLGLNEHGCSTYVGLIYWVERSQDPRCSKPAPTNRARPSFSFHIVSPRL